MSQTRCKMEVFPAFDLPMISTLNWIFGTRVGRRGAGDRAGDGAGAGDGGEGSGAGAGVGAGAGAKAGDRAGDDAAGGGRGDGTRQQILCFTPIGRRCCEKKDGIPFVGIPILVIIYTIQTSADWCA